MDTPDRFDGPPPSWTPAPLSPGGGALRPAWDEPIDPAAAPAGRKISPRLVWRALRRYWWQALALWVVASAGLATLAYTKIRPAFTSTAWLKIDLSKSSLLGNSARPTDLGTSLETQVALVTSPEVLQMAIHDPKVSGLPRFVRSADPESELRDQLQVAIQPKTQLILVSLSSERPQESADVVNAVVDAYLKTSDTWTDHETRAQMDRLKAMKKKFEADQADQRARLKKLTGDSKNTGINPNNSNSNLITAEQYRGYKNDLTQVELQRLEVESQLQAHESWYKQIGGGRSASPRRPGRLQGAALEEAVKRAFQAGGDVAGVMRDLNDARRRLRRAQDIAVKPGDPAVLHAQDRMDELKAEYEALWDKKAPALRQQLATGPVREEERDPQLERIDQLRLNVKTLEHQEAALRDKIAKLEVDTKVEGKEALDYRFADADLNHTDAMLDAITKNLSQLEYEAREGNKITVVALAKPNFRVQGAKKVAVVAAVPVLVLVLVLGLFTLLEASAGRVADPDDLPARVRVGVIGVVPPLPSLSAPRGPRALRDERRRVEEFVQSLDHLRVVLCAGQGGAPAGRRCVLITSATGGEGKTTLAAQLAGRCANAGLHTLLVDADLRRPSLGELLEVPEGPGLADVLAGEAEPEAAMVVIGNAGGFHLLPAGTPGHDPARLLQGDGLGRLIAQFRATFDVVIVDAPPVLAVPDALLLGRWTDGAVLAVRHDSSRYPLVERANRRLAAVGVPVFGAVVNGVRTVENSYGAYYHYQYASAGRDDDPAAT